MVRRRLRHAVACRANRLRLVDSWRRTSTPDLRTFLWRDAHRPSGFLKRCRESSSSSSSSQPWSFPSRTSRSPRWGYITLRSRCPTSRRRSSGSSRAAAASAVVRRRSSRGFSSATARIPGGNVLEVANAEYDVLGRATTVTDPPRLKIVAGGHCDTADCLDLGWNRGCVAPGHSSRTGRSEQAQAAASTAACSANPAVAVAWSSAAMKRSASSSAAPSVPAAASR